MLAIYALLLVATVIVPTLSDNTFTPQNDVSKLEPTVDHETVYSRAKRQLNGYPNGRRNTPIPIMFGGGGYGGRGMSFGGRGFGAGRGGFGGARGGFGGTRGGFGGARGGFGGARGGFGGGRGRG